MSLNTKCITCSDVPLSLETILKSLIRQDSDGNNYIPLQILACSSSDELAAECGSDYTAEQLLRSVLVIDDCGHCAVQVSLDATSFSLICDECPEDQGPI